MHPIATLLQHRDTEGIHSTIKEAYRIRISISFGIAAAPPAAAETVFHAHRSALVERTSLKVDALYLYTWLPSTYYYCISTAVHSADDVMTHRRLTTFRFVSLPAGILY